MLTKHGVVSFNSTEPVPLGKPPAVHLPKNFPDFMEPEGLVPYSQNPVTNPYHEPDQFRP
jgi:hypothetical protein